ncbi:MAG: TIGR02996 domain-containing protein [Gemmataceae bacterium]|nr:TIGR02996 domain-containing protein [Gemmataceae bacterium]
MDEMLPFLRAIAADPGDDTPRLAFADWLDEHDQHPRAEFIRLQIELERTDPSADGYAEKTARMRRCGVLTKKGKHRFFDYLPTKKCKIAFRRGFIDGVRTDWDTKQIDDSGFDLVPLQALSTSDKLLKKFRRFTKLKWLNYSVDRETAPERLLELFGPGGWFTELERLNLSGVGTTHFQAGVIPRFELPNLRTFYLHSDAFYDLGEIAAGGANEDDYDTPREWLGWPAHLPRNALPNPQIPLERFAWHSDDDSDSYRGGDWFWTGPTMESLLGLLNTDTLKQIEVAVDWDDHENGGEGPRAAEYQQNPLKLAPALDRVSVHGSNLDLLAGRPGRLKGLRVFFEWGDGVEDLGSLLAQPVCAELESLYVTSRAEGWGDEPLTASGLTLAKLRSVSPLNVVSNCHLPNLISATATLKTILGGRWPKLQTLRAHFDKFSDLRAFAQSDCCPNLTTLVVEEYFDGYYERVEGDFLFLAQCPHMPFLSLVRINGYRANGIYVVDGGQMIPVRADVLFDGLGASTPYRLDDPFA